MDKDTAQTTAQATLETLLGEYEPIYENYVYGKNKAFTAVPKVTKIEQCGAILLFVICTIVVYLNPICTPVMRYGIILSGVSLCISTAVRMICGQIVYRRTEDAVSPKEIRDFLKKTCFCHVGKSDVTYNTFTQRNGDTVSIRLLAEDQSSFLVSLRGTKGPVTKHDLVQNFTLIDGDKKQSSKSFPGITNQQYQDFPKKLKLTHLSIRMFPYTRFGKEQHLLPWIFMIPNTDAYKEIKESFELLCGTIMQGMMIDELTDAIKETRPVAGYCGNPDIAYDEDKIISYLTGNSSGSNAETVSDLLRNIESIVADESVFSIAKTEAIETHDTATTSHS